VKPGDLVKFTVSVYNDWGIGLVICDLSERGGDWKGYYNVLTLKGIKGVSYHFMELIE